MREDAFVRAPGAIPLPEDRRIATLWILQSFCVNAGKENWWRGTIFDARCYSAFSFEEGIKDFI